MNHAINMLLPHDTYLDIIPSKPSLAHLQLLSKPRLNIPKSTLLPEVAIYIGFLYVIVENKVA